MKFLDATHFKSWVDMEAALVLSLKKCGQYSDPKFGENTTFKDMIGHTCTLVKQESSNILQKEI